MRRTNSTPRSGLTLFSLLALLGVSGLLMAMFFPAVLKVRETARQMKCQNNLKQLAIAVHDYAEEFRQFPSVGKGDPEFGKETTGSWSFQILPYLEAVAYKDKNIKMTARTLYCPDRRVAMLYNDLPKSDYAGNAGTAPDPERLEVEDGIIGVKKVTFASILDGTSNTLLLGEKGLRTTEYLTGKGAGDKASCWAPYSIDTLRTSQGDQRVPKRDVADEDHEKGFGAVHARSCNFAFGDGSVRPIGYGIKGKTFQYLSCRNDGMVIDFNELQ